MTGRFRSKLLPLSFDALFADLRAFARGRLAHTDHATYNAVQKLSYLGVMALLILVILSGIAIWKPVQFGALCALFGGFQGSRLVHFLAMTGIVAFLLVHVGMSALVPRSLLAMIRGC